MKTSEIRAMTVDEIKHKVDEMKSNLMHLRFQRKIGQLTDFSKFKSEKKEIARFLTILTEKENKDGKK
ncbi:50S ribosomal protein L29 [Candidatus Calescamantes bacterium]|nr:50S ribosomal protein L29 [Candidatus Calescamantes bacterium]MCK5598439.1 50S ribosomal protein L29 [bacterium]